MNTVKLMPRSELFSPDIPFSKHLQTPEDFSESELKSFGPVKSKLNNSSIITGAITTETAMQSAAVKELNF